MRQKQQKDLDQLEREMEELKETSARKARGYESKITELEEEVHAALQGKREAERKMMQSRDSVPVKDVGESWVVGFQ